MISLALLHPTEAVSNDLGAFTVYKNRHSSEDLLSLGRSEPASVSVSPAFRRLLSGGRREGRKEGGIEAGKEGGKREERTTWWEVK